MARSSKAASKAAHKSQDSQPVQNHKDALELSMNRDEQAAKPTSPANATTRPPQPMEERPRRRLPMVRLSLTVVDPEDDGLPQMPITVELVIVNDEGDRTITADRDDLPELNHGGWREQGTSTLTVFSRAICGS